MRLIYDKFKSTNLDKFPISGGIRLAREFDEKSNATTDFNNPISREM